MLFATGYDYRLPFLDEDIFEWKDGRPQLYLNLIHRKLPGLYVLGFAEFADGAYRRFEEMAQMILADIHAREFGVRRELLDKLRESHFPDLRGGKAYIDLPRHAAYVDKDTYRDVLMSLLRDLGWPAPTDRSFEAMNESPDDCDAHPVRPHGARTRATGLERQTGISGSNVQARGARGPSSSHLCVRLEGQFDGPTLRQRRRSLPEGRRRRPGAHSDADRRRLSGRAH